ncbi:MAG: hypothetical protein AAF502_03785 [Bacteroidota bacterium]
MQYPKVLRNTVISGITLLLLFLLFKVSNDPDAPRTIDNISSTRSTLLFISAFILPGLLFGMAVAAGTPRLENKQVNKLFYVILCGLLYVGLFIPSIRSATHVLVFSGLGAFGVTVLYHLLINKLNSLPIYALIAAVGGMLAALPMFLFFDSPEMEEGLKDKMPFLPLLIFPIWHILVGGIIAKGAKLLQS